MNAPTLQYIGLTICAGLVLWGLYSAYTSIRFWKIALRNPQKLAALKEALVENPEDVPQEDVPQVGMFSPPSPSEEARMQREHHARYMREVRLHIADHLLAQDEHHRVGLALSLADELLEKNQTRPLPAMKKEKEE